MIEAEKNAIQAFMAVDPSCREGAHRDADDILLSFIRDIGYDSVAEAYIALKKRTGNFWYA